MLPKLWDGFKFSYNDHSLHTAAAPAVAAAVKTELSYRTDTIIALPLVSRGLYHVLLAKQCVFQYSPLNDVNYIM